MMKLIIMIGFLYAVLVADDISALQYSGVNTTYNDKEVFVERHKDKKCRKVGITPENIFGGDFAGTAVPKECKKSFVVSLGVVQAMKIDDEIETVGELEVLHYLQLMDFEPEKYIVVDTRRAEWFDKITIPHAVNIPKSEIEYDPEFPEYFDKSLQVLHIKKDKKGKLDFSEAKDAILFCNGSWCTQSAIAIKALVKLGYPKKKLHWYRGGLQDWMGMGFSVVRGK